MEGRAAVAAIRPLAPNALVRFERLDLESLASVAEFAARLEAAGRRVDVLINNADAVVTDARRSTADGFERQLGANFLAHFALTARLLPLLRQARRPRVVHLASIARHRTSLAWDDLQLERDFDPARAYWQSMTAILLFADELQQRSDEHGWGLASAAAQRGPVRMQLAAEAPYRRGQLRRLRKSLEEGPNYIGADGASPGLYAATVSTLLRGGFYSSGGVVPYASGGDDTAAGDGSSIGGPARRIWEAAEQLTGVVWPRE